MGVRLRHELAKHVTRLRDVGKAVAKIGAQSDACTRDHGRNTLAGLLEAKDILHIVEAGRLVLKPDGCLYSS